MTHQPPHIVIAGGGVAAVEAVAALRALAGSLPRITLLAPEAALAPRAASVATPFGFGAPSPLPFDAIRRHARFDLHRGTLKRVEPEEHVAVDEQGEPIRYDKLLVAVGARPEPAVPGAITFAGLADAPAVARAVEEASRLVFVLPSATGWALPVYELAIMAAVELRNRGVTPEITVVTPEPAPLWVFGAEASAAIAELLAERGIGVRAGVRPVAVRDGSALPHPGSRTARTDSFPSTGTAACRTSRTSSPRATRPPFRSSRAVWRRNRPTPPPRRLPRNWALRSSRRRSGRCCAAC